MSPLRHWFAVNCFLFSAPPPSSITAPSIPLPLPLSLSLPLYHTLSRSSSPHRWPKVWMWSEVTTEGNCKNSSILKAFKVKNYFTKPLQNLCSGWNNCKAPFHNSLLKQFASFVSNQSLSKTHCQNVILFIYLCNKLIPLNFFRKKKFRPHFILISEYWRLNNWLPIYPYFKYIMKSYNWCWYWKSLM